VNTESEFKSGWLCFLEARPIAALTCSQILSISTVPHPAPNDDEALICTLFIEDDRYSVPTIAIVPFKDVPDARALAESKLRASSHYREIEVRREDELLFILRRDEIE
jgi:hypothetical protein